MKTIAMIAAAALLSATLPAMAQTVNNSQGEAINPPPVIDAGPSTNAGSLDAITSVKVLAVPNANGLSLDGGPNSGVTKSTKVAEALAQSGYSGSQIIGYDVDGSSLTVYVKAS